MQSSLGKEQVNIYSMSSHQFLDHTADMTMRVQSADKKSLFIQGALGLMELVFGDLSKEVSIVEHEELELSATDRDMLFADWLSELHVRAVLHGVMVRDLRINYLSDDHIEATLYYGRATPTREIKAVTLHNLHLMHTDHQWQVDVTFDL